MCGVYQIKNLKNGKIYIGSSKDIAKRWQAHRYALNHNIHHNIFLQKDWKHYGKDSFVFSVLEKCEEDDRWELEQKYLDNFLPFYRNGKGYNISEKATEQNSTGYRFYSDGRFFGKRMKAVGGNFSMIVTEEEYNSKTREELIERYNGAETLYYLHDDILACNPEWDD